jgi:galactokinase
MTTPAPLALEAAQIYQTKFNGNPFLFRSPGRINLIGEHTDYNQGFVLPAAIDKAVYLAAGLRTDQRVCLYAMSYKEDFEVSLSDVQKTPGHWSNYLLGVAAVLREKGFPLGGFNLVVGSDVPVGAGLSSSAALECATVFALNDLFGLRLEKKQMILIAQQAEHQFAGVLCGIMDQFASMYGKKDHVMKLDCRSMDFQYLPAQLGEYELVLLNSNVSHSLASSAYNQRRSECARAVALIQDQYPSVESLRDCTLPMLQECVAPVDQISFTRARYVVEEIERLQAACTALEDGDIQRLGELMFETHDGLSKMYEVSCPETDFLVDFVRNNAAVAGARMMGGGFGGCTLNLVRKDRVASLTPQIAQAYSESMGRELSVIEVKIEEGSSRLSS